MKPSVFSCTAATGSVANMFAHQIKTSKLRSSSRPRREPILDQGGQGEPLMLKSWCSSWHIPSCLQHLCWAATLKCSRTNFQRPCHDSGCICSQGGKVGQYSIMFLYTQLLVDLLSKIWLQCLLSSHPNTGTTGVLSSEQNCPISMPNHLQQRWSYTNMMALLINPVFINMMLLTWARGSTFC